MSSYPSNHFQANSPYKGFAAFVASAAASVVSGLSRALGYSAKPGTSQQTPVASFSSSPQSFHNQQQSSSASPLPILFPTLPPPGQLMRKRARAQSPPSAPESEEYEEYKGFSNDQVNDRDKPGRSIRPLSVEHTARLVQNKFYAPQNGQGNFKVFMIIIKGATTKLILATPELKLQTHNAITKFFSAISAFENALGEVKLEPDIPTQFPPTNQMDIDGMNEPQTIDEFRNYINLLNYMAGRGAYAMIFSTHETPADIALPPFISVEEEMKIREAAAAFLNIAAQMSHMRNFFPSSNATPGNALLRSLEVAKAALLSRESISRERQIAEAGKQQHRREAKRCRISEDIIPPVQNEAIFIPQAIVQNNLDEHNDEKEAAQQENRINAPSASAAEIVVPRIPSAPTEQIVPLPPVLGENFNNKAISDDDKPYQYPLSRELARTRPFLARPAKKGSEIRSGIKEKFFDILKNFTQINTTELDIKKPCRPQEPWENGPMLIENEQPNWITKASLEKASKKLAKAIIDGEKDKHQFDDSKVQCEANSLSLIVCSLQCCEFYRHDFHSPKKTSERPPCEGALVRLVLQKSLMYELFGIRRQYEPVVRIVPVKGGAGYGMEYLGYVENGAPIEEMKTESWTAEMGPFCAYQGLMRINDDVEEKAANGNNYLAKISSHAALDSSSHTFGNLAAYINRSCRPNVKFQKWLMDERPHILIVLAENQQINPKDQVTADYPLPTGVKCLCWKICRFEKKYCLGENAKK